MSEEVPDVPVAVEADPVPVAVGDVVELDAVFFNSAISQATKPFLVGASVCVMAPTKTQSFL